MNCPQCGSKQLKTPIVNSHDANQTVRKRRCDDCLFVWFTVELRVPDYSIGWAPSQMHKPVIRCPVNLTTSCLDEIDWSVHRRKSELPV
jgi:hypothetical protein